MRNRLFNLSTRVPFNLVSVPRSCKEPLTKFRGTCYVFLYSAAFFGAFFFTVYFLPFTLFVVVIIVICF